MLEENEQPQVEEETLEEEESIEEEEQDIHEEEEETPDIPQEDSVVLSKSDYNKLNRKAIAYETVKKSPKKKSVVSGPDSIDLIKLGKKLQDYSDDELDFVTDFAKSKKPDDVLKALNNEFVQQGISAHRAKAEKERLAVKPSNTQPESETPKSLVEKLATARSNSDKQKILEEAGLYQEPSNNPNRAMIG